MNALSKIYTPNNFERASLGGQKIIVLSAVDSNLSWKSSYERDLVVTYRIPRVMDAQSLEKFSSILSSALHINPDTIVLDGLPVIASEEIFKAVYTLLARLLASGHLIVLNDVNNERLLSASKELEKRYVEGVIISSNSL